MRCRNSARSCPILRRCPCCGTSFTSIGRRITHQNKCREPIDIVLATLIGEHAKHHGYR